MALIDEVLAVVLEDRKNTRSSRLRVREVQVRIAGKMRSGKLKLVLTPSENRIRKALRALEEKHPDSIRFDGTEVYEPTRSHGVSTN